MLLKVPLRCKLPKWLENSVVTFAEAQPAATGAWPLIRDSLPQAKHSEHTKAGIGTADSKKLLVIFEQTRLPVIQLPYG